MHIGVTQPIYTVVSKTAPPCLPSSRCYTIIFVLRGLDRNNTYVHMLLIDFNKAFDHIDNNFLLEKLKTNGIPQICVEWQHAF